MDKPHHSSTRLGLIVLSLELLVAAGWFAHNRIEAAKKSGESDQVAAESLQQSSDGSSSQATAEPSEQPTAASTSNKNYDWSTMAQGPYQDSVYYTTSSSLTDWPSTEGTALQEHASVPDVIAKDGVLYAYYVDVTEDGKPEQIGVRTSSDNGASWGQKKYVVFQNARNRVPVDPAPYLLPDGKIRLYYLDIAEVQAGKNASHKIYSAISSDGVTFTQEDGARFTYDKIFDPDVVNVDGSWRMYVGTHDNKVLSTTSSDGLSFSYEGVAYSGGAIPNVIYENKTYYLFTGGIDISSSKDGKTFTKLNKRFSPAGLTADPGVTKLSDGRYLMVYKTKSASDQPPDQQAKP